METQARVVLPPELQEFALKGWDSCRAVRKFVEAIFFGFFF